MAPSSNTPMASSTSSRKTASAASSASPGCPFNIPRFNPATKKVYKCTLCSDRVGQGLEPACIKSCPTGCLHFGTKEDMLILAENARQATARCLRLQERRRVRSRQASAARTSSTSCTMPSNPELYGGLPKNPRVSLAYKGWKSIFKPLGLFGGHARLRGRDLPLRVRRTQAVSNREVPPREAEIAGGQRRRRDGDFASDACRTKTRRRSTTLGRTVVHKGELLRHPSIPASCTGRTESSSSWRCSPGSPSTCR